MVSRVGLCAWWSCCGCATGRIHTCHTSQYCSSIKCDTPCTAIGEPPQVLATKNQPELLESTFLSYLPSQQTLPELSGVKPREKPHAPGASVQQLARDRACPSCAWLFFLASPRDHALAVLKNMVCCVLCWCVLCVVFGTPASVTPCHTHRWRVKWRTSRHSVDVVSVAALLPSTLPTVCDSRRSCLRGHHAN